MQKFIQVQPKLSEENLFQKNEIVNTINEQGYNLDNLNDICTWDSSPFYIHRVRNIYYKSYQLIITKNI